ncbi:MAG: Rpn family recombination-promoting nuclease/putative transposase [Lachnoclostridium sp.]|nr:Rpn family recombination-promoting nuclease/putative transposase [Lachnoclostridium sp.]
MKHILRDKANFGVLEGLLTVLIGDKISIEEILESESNQDTDLDKFNRVDIKAKNSEGHIVIVEVQLTRQLHYLQRILYGTSKAVTEHISLGDQYDQVKKVYSVSILYCDLGRGDDYVYHGKTTFKGLHTGNDLQVSSRVRDKIIPVLPEKVFPEYYIIRVNEFDKIPNSPLDEWLEYLKNGVIKEDTRTPGLQEARKKLQVLKMSTKERRAYEAHVDNIMIQNDVLSNTREEGVAEGLAAGIEIGHERGLEEGLEKGKELGREEGKREAIDEVIRKMKEAGMSDDMIEKLL